MSIKPALRRVTNQFSYTSPKIHNTCSQHDNSSQTFQLPDGRVLGFAEYGNPNGRPLLYFHGYPSSRIEAEAADTMAQRCGIRILSLDRPGFGLSTPQPERTLLDWPKDVQTFAHGMGLERFAVMGLWRAFLPLLVRTRCRRICSLALACLRVVRLGRRGHIICL